MRSRELVLLIHGLGGSRLDMWPMQRHLQRAGFRAINWNYRSIGNAVETHAQRLKNSIDEFNDDPAIDSIHIAGHSMGGIITRTMLSNLPSEALTVSKLQRVVMLASPQRGSHAARRLEPWVGWMSPALGQLSDEPESFVNQLANPFQKHGIEFATIEASKDRVVDSSSVQLEGQADFARMIGHHGYMPWYRDAMQLVESFLIHGRFETSESDCSTKVVK